MSSDDLLMKRLELCDIQQTDSLIRVDLKYSTTDNFLRTDIYGDLQKAYLQPEVARKLSEARRLLQKIRPELTLLVYDAGRPSRFQRIIWDSLRVPRAEKGKYACSPLKGSAHNYGAAVDVTLADSNGKPLDMGCSFDFFGPLAYPYMEEHFVKTGALTPKQAENRRLLRLVMKKAGFSSIPTEWWHFNACSRDVAAARYPRIG